MRGKFILLEGIEASGKSTQAKMLVEELNNSGVKTILTKEPGSSYISFNVRDLLLDADKKINPIARELLFQADRAEHSTFIKGQIEEGTWVVSDRGFVSGLAYALSHNHNREYLKYVVEWVTQIYPDIIFYVKISPELSMSRLESRGQLKTFEETQGIAHFKNISENFDKIISQITNHQLSTLILDGEKSIEELHKEIMTAIKNI